MADMMGAGSMFCYLDKRVIVMLRDGRTLLGILRSVDQFCNMVLHRTTERIHVGNKYADIERGIFVIRAENLVLMGESDDDKITMVQSPVDSVLEEQAAEIEKKQAKSRLRNKPSVMEEDFDAV